MFHSSIISAVLSNRFAQEFETRSDTNSGLRYEAKGETCGVKNAVYDSRGNSGLSPNLSRTGKRII
jgi:hypothetical protein